MAEHSRHDRFSLGKENVTWDYDTKSKATLRLVNKTEFLPQRCSFGDLNIHLYDVIHKFFSYSTPKQKQK
jgi:hypothetical protein